RDAATGRFVAALVLAAVGAATPTTPVSAEMLVLRTHNAQDIVITLLAPAGEWVTGENHFVIEFDSAPRKRLIDAGSPTVTVSVSGTGSRPVQAEVHLQRRDVSGRYVGTITLPRAGDWDMTVVWNGATSKGSTTFSVPVRSRTR